MRPQLSVCLFSRSEILAQSLRELLSADRYTIIEHESSESFFSFLEHEKHQTDCLILQQDTQLSKWITRLHRNLILLPAIILRSEDVEIGKTDLTGWQTATVPVLPDSQDPDGSNSLYHAAEVLLSVDQLNHIPDAIEQAITQFLKLSPTCRLTNQPTSIDPVAELTTQNMLMLQQRRLTEKLKERLGYLGVYYKRDSRNFYRYLHPSQQQQLSKQLKSEYRDIILNYFSRDSISNQKIDDFVNTSFFADISVSQIVEIHMELMDEFSKQLKLEGRNEEVLLDYRLTLIDVIAHLCEMYRRSIPREA